MIYLKVAYEDTLDVYDGDQRIGAIAPSFDGWAVHQANSMGGIVERRCATEKSIESALARLTD